MGFLNLGFVRFFCTIQAFHFSHILTLILILNLSTIRCLNTATPTDQYHESLFIRPMQDGQIHAEFKFETFYRQDLDHLRWENKFQLFPLPIAEIVSTTQLNELHFSLTRGNWLYDTWGYPTRQSPPGAQVWASFKQYNQDADKSWDLLVKSLSGKFCVSLTSIDHKTTSHPKLSFRSSSNQTKDDLIYYSNIVDESLCTENLTPWKKLLPCFSRSGLSSLLNSGYLFKSTYSSLGVDIMPRCLDSSCKKSNIMLSQTMTVVFNAARLFEGSQSWSLAKLIGSSLTNFCPVAQSSKIYIENTNSTSLGPSTIFPSTYKTIKGKFGSNERSFAEFDVESIIVASTEANKSTTNVGQRFPGYFVHSDRKKSVMEFSTHVAGVGLFGGTIIGIIKNNGDRPVNLTYLHTIPHYLRIYLHTLTIRSRTNEPIQYENLNHIPSRDRGRLTSIEFQLSMPANTVVEVSYDFERAFLSWTEYRPDANRGVLLSSAVVSVELPNRNEEIFFAPKPQDSGSSNFYDERDVGHSHVMVKIYARPLLVVLPTPDFSMPYNVICLVSTVLATAFGPLHALTSKKQSIDTK